MPGFFIGVDLVLLYGGGGKLPVENAGSYPCTVVYDSVIKKGKFDVGI